VATTLIQIVSVTVPATGSTVANHTLNVNGTGVRPDHLLIGRSGSSLDVDPASVTTTQFTVTNSGGAPVTAFILLIAWHTIVREFGNGAAGAFQGLTPQPFVSPAGGGNTGNMQSFSFTATGAEGSDFFVTLPTARANDNYGVHGSLGGAAVIFGMDFPDLVAGDRTTTQFRVQTTAAVTAGDRIDFLVLDRF